MQCLHINVSIIWMFFQIISAVSGGTTDLSFDALGYAWQMVNCILTASYSVSFIFFMHSIFLYLFIEPTTTSFGSHGSFKYQIQLFFPLIKQGVPTPFRGRTNPCRCAQSPTNQVHRLNQGRIFPMGIEHVPLGSKPRNMKFNIKHCLLFSENYFYHSPCN